VVLHLLLDPPCHALQLLLCLGARTFLRFLGLAARPLGRTEAAIVGVGMVPRGEVGIVVASIGAAEGVVDAELFAVVVGMAVLTTLVAPFGLRRLSRG